MNTLLAPTDNGKMEALTMRLARVDSALPNIKDVLTDMGEENLVYLSSMVPSAQKELIVNLAKLNRSKQAAVLRAIIDEWCAMKLNEYEGEA